MVDPVTVRPKLAQLFADPEADRARTAVCEALARALTSLGQLLWVTGWLIGEDRVARPSPVGFGSDGLVGLATVAQTGGELGAGTVMLLSAGNRYAASALLRQIVEVDYLAWAFADDHKTAAEWLHADRETRRRFWTPAELRKRSGGRFLASDYWHHCDLGGHPTPEAMLLLPDHQRRVESAFLWVELASHLHHVWDGVTRAAELLVPGGLPNEWLPTDLDVLIQQWENADRLRPVVGDLVAILRNSVDPAAT